MASDDLNKHLTRRQLLKAAGGITFLALAPLQNGLFAATFRRNSKSELPVFTALPYLQPGPNGDKLISSKESVVICWQTDGVPAEFTLEYGPTKALGQKAKITRQDRLAKGKAVVEQRVNHVATLTDLSLNQLYYYRVRMNGQLLLEGYGTTRKPQGVKTRFVSFGDNSCGSKNDHAIAYQAYRARPDFVMNVGDNVYDAGLDSEYARHFFPVYNAEKADPKLGAPLLRSVPFYSVIANHDISGHDALSRLGGDFNRHEDSLAYFTSLHMPLNGPKPSHPPAAFGEDAAVVPFKSCAGVRYPKMVNYSFDYGDAHFLCLDSNVYVDPTDAKLQEWISADLRAATAAWKFVVYHHPAYNAGYSHYAEQHMRVLTPILEQFGVDVVLSGHEHNYQRSRPLRFAPKSEAAAKLVNSGRRHVPGVFTIDRKFDGKSVTKPDGILYLVTGAGGNGLYDASSNNNPAKWLHPEDNNVDYVTKFVSDRHSLTVCDMDAKSLSFKQIDGAGTEIDRFTITRS